MKQHFLSNFSWTPSKVWLTKSYAPVFGHKIGGDLFARRPQRIICTNLFPFCLAKLGFEQGVFHMFWPGVVFSSSRVFERVASTIHSSCSSFMHATSSVFHVNKQTVGAVKNISWSRASGTCCEVHSQAGRLASLNYRYIPRSWDTNLFQSLATWWLKSVTTTFRSWSLDLIYYWMHPLFSAAFVGASPKIYWD